MDYQWDKGLNHQNESFSNASIFNGTDNSSSYMYDYGVNGSSDENYYYGNYYDYDYELPWQHFVYTDLLKYIPPILLILGTVGNVLAFWVWRFRMATSNTSLYFTSLALVDTIALWSSLIRYWVLALTDKDFRNDNIFACKVHHVLVYWSLEFSTWILGAVSIDRCIGVQLPHLYHSICTRKRTKIALTVIGVCLALIDGTYFTTTFSIITTNEYRECYMHDQHVEFHQNVWHWVHLCLYSFLPFLIIVACNVLIIIQVTKNKSIRAQTNNNAQSQSLSLTVMLIVNCVACLLFTSPAALYLSIQPFVLVPDASVELQANMYLFFACSVLLSGLNNSANFYLYCLSGPKFRKAIKKQCKYTYNRVSKKWRTSQLRASKNSSSGSGTHTWSLSRRKSSSGSTAMKNHSDASEHMNGSIPLRLQEKSQSNDTINTLDTAKETKL